MAEDFSRWTVVQLRAALKERGEPTTGLKAELVARMERSMAAGGRAKAKASPKKASRARGSSAAAPEAAAAAGGGGAGGGGGGAAGGGRGRAPRAAGSSRASPKGARASPKARAKKASPSSAPKAAAWSKARSLSDKMGVVAGEVLHNEFPSADRMYAANGPPFPVRGWSLIKKLGGGAEADVWLAEAVDHNDQPLRPKLEVALKIASDTSALFREAHLMHKVGCHRPEAAEASLPRLYAHGLDYRPGKPSKIKFLALPVLGKTCRELWLEHDKNFSMTTLRLMGANIVRALRFVHGQNMLYRDVSFHNMMNGAPGTPQHNQLFLIDVGCAEPINAAGNKSFAGTPAFASGNALQIRTPCGPADDLEALGHLLAWFHLGGNLPWLGLSGAVKVQNKTYFDAQGRERNGRHWKPYMDSLKPTVIHDFLQYIHPYCDDAYHAQLPDSVYDDLLDILLDGLPKNAKYDWADNSSGAGATRSPRRGAASSPASRSSSSASAAAAAAAAAAAPAAAGSSARGKRAAPTTARRDTARSGSRFVPAFFSGGGKEEQEDSSSEEEEEEDEEEEEGEDSGSSDEDSGAGVAPPSSQRTRASPRSSPARSSSASRKRRRRAQDLDTSRGGDRSDSDGGSDSDGSSYDSDPEGVSDAEEAVNCVVM